MFSIADATNVSKHSTEALNRNARSPLHLCPTQLCSLYRLSLVERLNVRQLAALAEMLQAGGSSSVFDDKAAWLPHYAPDHAGANFAIMAAWMPPALRQSFAAHHQRRMAAWRSDVAIVREMLRVRDGASRACL